MNVVTGRSLVVTRWIARLPRIALLTVCAVLVIAGARAAVAPKPPTTLVKRVYAATDQQADAIAEAFTRAYLTWDGSTASRLSAFGTSAPPPELAPSARQSVRWTAVSGSEQRGRERIVTVAALTDRGPYTVAVSLRRMPHGAVAVDGAPALVGATPIDREPRIDAAADLADTAVRAVLQRAVTNYLAGDRTDLLADLDAGARVSLPEQRFRVRAVDAISWIALGRRAAVELRASSPAGAVLALRYELDLVRRGARWYVRSIQSPPTTGRSS